MNKFRIKKYKNNSVVQVWSKRTGKYYTLKLFGTLKAAEDYLEKASKYPVYDSVVELENHLLKDGL